MKNLKFIEYKIILFAVLASYGAQAQTAPNCTQKPISKERATTDGGYAWIVPGSFGTPADNNNKPTQSILRIFENNIEIKPAHSSHRDIRRLGNGRFSHYAKIDGSGEAVRLSALNNSNIKTNGKTYTYCIGTVMASPTQSSTLTITPTIPLNGPGTVPKVASVALGSGAVYYVSPSGDDLNPGTLEKPWLTLSKAASTVTAGQTVYLRGGVYNGYFAIRNSGTESNRISFVAYPNETPIIDGTSIKTNTTDPKFASYNTINIKGSYITLRGLEVRNSARTGIDITGNYVVVDQVNVYNNYLTGIAFYMASYGVVTNSIVHDSYDYGLDGTGGGGNADCISSSAGNTPTTVYGYHTFDNNLLYNCSDDGLDTWTSQYNIVRNNIIHHAGYSNLSNGGSKSADQPAGNGSGVKVGPGGNNTVSNNVTYNNRVRGYTDNDGPSNKFYNNTAYNTVAGFVISKIPAATLKNNLSYGSSINIISEALQSNNSWNLSITNPQFASTDSGNANFLMLSGGSPAIDKGVNVGLPYKGTAPDLGAYEY